MYAVWCYDLGPVPRNFEKGDTHTHIHTRTCMCINTRFLLVVASISVGTKACVATSTIVNAGKCIQDKIPNAQRTDTKRFRKQRRELEVRTNSGSTLPSGTRYSTVLNQILHSNPRSTSKHQVLPQRLRIALDSSN